MSAILLKNVLLSGESTNVLIEGNRFGAIGPEITCGNAPSPAPEILDFHGRMAILPPYYNGHTHAAMALLRGYADDYDLFDWLSNHIWPLEAKMTEEDVYAGTRLACLEMIKSGTVFFNDMYWFQRGTIRAADEMGMRADIGIMVLSQPGADQRTANDDLAAGRVPHSERIRISMAPHAIYTVSGEKLRECARFAKGHGMPIQIHLAETKQEFDDCMKEHGTTPAAYLDSLGLLTENTTLAHSVWLTGDDFRLVAERRSILVHNPVSNCKLSSGVFRYKEAKDTGCRVILGTDGNSSNNNLSMIEELKIAALLAKSGSGDPKTLNAEEAFRLATTEAARAFGRDAGVIETGRLADCMIVDLDNPLMAPGYHMIADMVYSADSSCVDTVICDGKILMRHRVVPGEEEIIAAAKKTAGALLKR